MISHPTILKDIGKLVIIDAIFINRSYEDCEIVMSIYSLLVTLMKSCDMYAIRDSEMTIPISGVSVKILSTLSSTVFGS